MSQEVWKFTMSLPIQSIAAPTGEVPWVMRMIKAYHAEAACKGVKIVNFCGFDSIPSELGTTFLVNHMQEKLNR